MKKMDWPISSRHNDKFKLVLKSIKYRITGRSISMVE